MPSRFCLRKPSRKSLLAREIEVELVRAGAPQNTELERYKNQALSRPTPRQCWLPALRIWQQKQIDPDAGFHAPTIESPKGRGKHALAPHVNLRYFGLCTLIRNPVADLHSPTS